MALNGARSGRSAPFARITWFARALMIAACGLSSACAAKPATTGNSEPDAVVLPSAAYERTRSTRTAADIEPTVLHARNAVFRFDAGIGFFLDRLVASAEPVAPNTLIVLDDPTSFKIVTHRGQVRLNAAQVSALFNQYTFAFEGAPLRDLKVSLAPGEVTLAGEYRRRGWVDFKVSGGLELLDDKTLALNAERIVVEGLPAASLLDKANVRLDAILDINARGLKLVGNRIELAAEQLFPPPALEISIVDVTVEADGIALEIDDGRDDVPELTRPETGDDRYILLRGGDIRLMRTIVPQADVALLPAPDAGPGDFGLWLYDYRQQIAAGYFDYRDGDGLPFYVYIPPLPAVAAP